MKLIPSVRTGLTSAWEACKKPSRLALAALVLGILFSVNLSAFDSAHAQTPAPAAAPAAAGSEPRTAARAGHAAGHRLPAMPTI